LLERAEMELVRTVEELNKWQGCCCSYPVLEGVEVYAFTILASLNPILQTGSLKPG